MMAVATITYFLRRSWIVLRICFILILLTSNVEAVFKEYTAEGLVDDSQLIVRAELVGATELEVPNQRTLVLGALMIETVLKGSADAGQIVFIELPAKVMRARSDSIFYDKGEYGWWFLAATEKGSAHGVYRADHPQRFTKDPSTAEWVSKILAQ